MKFSIIYVVLWLKNGKRREIKFLDNKVNVITGGSNTGKSAILQIIDYCLFASKSKISESMINENVNWYGICFHINDKRFSICRTALEKQKVTGGYYFSASGEIPDLPLATHDEGTLKSIIEVEFGIDRNVTIPFGGRSLSAGSKISLRYFLMFTTISQDIITNSSVFFDKQSESRYAEALIRIFDLAVGIETLKNLLAKEERSRLESELKKVRRKESRMTNVAGDFGKELSSTVKQAKEYGLISPDESVKDSLPLIRDAIEELNFTTPVNEVSSRQSDLLSDIGLQNRILRNLKLLKKEYDEYRKMLNTVEDSLRPIEFIKNNLSEVVQTSVFDQILSIIETDLTEVRSDIKSRVPIDTNIGDLIAEQESKIAGLKTDLRPLPQRTKTFAAEKDKYLFMGELKAKMELYVPELEPESFVVDLGGSKIEDQLASIDVKDTSEERAMFLSLLEEVIQSYLRIAGEALENYAGYLAVFDYKDKVLSLRKPKTDFVENVGSSSNHMFMHLCMFLGLHETIKIKKSPFVPSFLIVDQPSRPYWGEKGSRRKKLKSGDEFKVRRAFELMNSFVEKIVKEQESQCQLIVFEHVPPSTWEGLANVHLVDTFRDGNALVQLDK